MVKPTTVPTPTPTTTQSHTGNPLSAGTDQKSERSSQSLPLLQKLKRSLFWVVFFLGAEGFKELMARGRVELDVPVSKTYPAKDGHPVPESGGLPTRR